MPQENENSLGRAPLPRRRFQFTIAGLLTTTVAVAVGSSVRWVENGSWADGPLLAAAAWMVIGLFWQAYDMFAWRRRAVGLSAEQRFGWLFAIAWRVLISGLFVAYYVILQLPDRGRLLLPEDEHGNLWSGGSDLRNALFYSGLIIVLCSVGLPRPSRRATHLSRVVGLLGIAGGVFLAAWVCHDQTFVPALVGIAVFGIEAATSNQFIGEAMSQDYASQLGHFFLTAWASLGLVGLGAVFIHAMARQWDRRWLRRLCLGGVVLSLAPAAAFGVWTYGGQLQWLLPCMAEALGWARPHEWIAAAILGLMLVTVAAWQRCHVPGVGGSVAWRRDAGHYYHERVPVLLLTCAAAVLLFWKPLNEASKVFGALDAIAIGVLFETPQSYLVLALLLSAVAALVRCARRTDRSAWNTPAAIDPARFWTTCVALALLLAAALPAIAWAAFGSWFMF